MVGRHRTTEVGDRPVTLVKDGPEARVGRVAVDDKGDGEVG